MQTLGQINSATVNNLEHIPKPQESMTHAIKLNENIVPENLHSEVLNSQSANPLIEKIKNPNVYNSIISGINAILHGIATCTALLPQTKSIQSLNSKFNEIAFFCTRYIAPFFSFAISAGTAFLDKKPIETLIKLIPPVFLPLVGDSNIDIVYGSCFSFNQPYDLLLKRVEAKSAEDKSYAEHVEKSNQSYSGNLQLVKDTFKEMLQDLSKGKMPLRESWYFINCTLMLIGSWPLLLFDRKSRDSSMAKILGLVRNLGGIMGDLGFVLFDRDNSYKLLVSALCSTSAIASIAKRWVSERSSRTLIHLSAALDVAAYAAWNAFNSNQHKKPTKPVHNLNHAAA